MTLYHIEEEMNKTYHLEHLWESYEESYDDNEATESSLITPGAGRTRRFQGECSMCGEKVHHVFEYICTGSNITQGWGGPIRGINKGSGVGGNWPRFKGTYHGCGMIYHMMKYFWYDSENSNKKPEGCKCINNG